MFFDDRKKVIVRARLRAWPRGCFALQFDLTCLRQVSLAGKSKSRTQETKQDFLERTRREREARETQRRREKAALDVQVFCCRMCGSPYSRPRRSTFVAMVHSGHLIYILARIDRPLSEGGGRHMTTELWSEAAGMMSSSRFPRHGQSKHKSPVLACACSSSMWARSSQCLRFRCSHATSNAFSCLT